MVNACDRHSHGIFEVGSRRIIVTGMFVLDIVVAAALANLYVSLIMAGNPFGKVIMASMT